MIVNHCLPCLSLGKYRPENLESGGEELLSLKDKSIVTMNSSLEKETFYQSPSVEVTAIIPEGILCDSGENSTEYLDENIGVW